MTDIEATIAAHTCRQCGEEFATIAEKIDHPCNRGVEPTAQDRLNQWLDARNDGAVIRDVENLHRDVVARLSEADAAQMLHQLVVDQGSALEAAQALADRYRSQLVDAAAEQAAQRADGSLDDHAPNCGCGAHLASHCAPTATARATMLREFEAQRQVEAPTAPLDPPLPNGAFPNRYDGECFLCSAMVDATTGWCHRNETGRWVVRHRSGECRETPAQTEAREAHVPYFAQDGEVHLVGSTFYRFRAGRQSRRIYAQRAILTPQPDGSVDVEWRYAPAARHECSTETRLTWDQARDFGVLTNRCIRCNYNLRTTRSIAQGYGPDCAEIMGWPTLTEAEAEAIIAERTAR